MPNIGLNVPGVQGVTITFGGSNLGAVDSAFAASERDMAARIGFNATLAGRAAQYAIRANEWILQHNLAAREIMQLDRQILAANLRKQIAERELENHKRQLEELIELEDAMRDKLTNREFYDWMVARLSDLHFASYQLAYDWAKRAQRAARLELQRPQLNEVHFGHWDGLHKGLLAGEELDSREEPMVKHVSLIRVDPAALVRLRETGRADFTLPETLFDLDCPGQYMRRLKSVALTIPSVTGPYIGIHARLTLLRSTIRTSASLAGRARVYARERDKDDSRFSDLLGQPQSIVTSSAQNDSGVFETSLEDPRYLPFEGLGAVGEWRIELPSAFRAFDRDSISDVILHLRYTARNGGTTLRTAVETELTTALNAVTTASAESGLVHGFSLRHETPTAWRRMLEQPENGENLIELPIERDRLPFFIGSRKVTIRRILVLVRLSADFYTDYSDKLTGTLAPAGRSTPPGPDTLAFATWQGGIVRANWDAESIELRAIDNSGNSPSPWRLSLQTTASGAAGPVASAALEDIELLVGYTLD